MGYRVIYLDGEEGRPKKNCKICEELERNVIEPVAIITNYQAEKFSDLRREIREELIRKHNTCIFHCQKENRNWIKNFEEYQEWKQQRESISSEKRKFEDSFKIKWDENLVNSFWKRLRAYCFVIENLQPFNENTPEIIQILKNLNLSQDEFQRAKRLVEFYLRTFINYEINEDEQPEYFHDFKDFIFPQFTSPLIEYINTPFERKSKVTFNEKPQIFVAKESFNFWYKNDSLYLTKKAYFINTTFLDHVYLDGTRLEKCNLIMCKFQRELNLRKAKISALELSLSNIEEKTNITETNIEVGSFISNTFKNKWTLKLWFNDILLQDNKVSKDLIFKAFKGQKPHSRNLTIKKIDFQPNGLFILEGLTKTNLSLKNILNENFNFFIKNCTWNEENSKLEINNSILRKTLFLNWDFSKGKIEIQNSDLMDIKIANVNWGEISEERICQELFKNDPEKARDVYRQLKLAHDNQKDHITANEFYALEMKAYERVLEKKPWLDIKYFQKKLVFLLYRFTSTYGQSWAKPLSLITLLTIANTGYQQFYDLSTYLSTLFTSKFFPVVFPLMLGGLTSLALLEIISAKLEAILWFIVIGLALTGITAFHKFPTKSFLDTCAETFNIFKLFGSSANHIKHPFIHTLYAIATAFLIYQIIVVVRRQVRR